MGAAVSVLLALIARIDFLSINLDFDAIVDFSFITDVDYSYD